jgi:hypothetical protein
LFNGWKGWIHEALQLVEIVPVALLDEERTKVNAATALQAHGQARTKGNEVAPSATSNGGQRGPRGDVLFAIKKARIDPPQ